MGKACVKNAWKKRQGKQNENKVIRQPSRLRAPGSAPGWAGHCSGWIWVKINCSFPRAAGSAPFFAVVVPRLVQAAEIYLNFSHIASPKGVCSEGHGQRAGTEVQPRCEHPMHRHRNSFPWNPRSLSYFHLLLARATKEQAKAKDRFNFLINAQLSFVLLLSGDTSSPSPLPKLQTSAVIAPFLPKQNTSPVQHLHPRHPCCRCCTVLLFSVQSALKAQ